MDVQVAMPPPPPPPPPPPAFFAQTTNPQLTTPPPPPPPQPATTVSVATTSTQDRIWLHPWTVTEMRENASQWSLAGDAGVLLYLEQFSDRLTQRADAIQQHLSQTVNAVKSTHTRVLNCLNEFTSLANTQFIENRVYDEDETASAATAASKKDEQSTDKTNVSNIEAQEKVLQRYVEAIQNGLTILDTHFERVETKLENTQNGRSSFVEDDEDGGVPLEPILEPKDPYIFRPLPHIIGTTEFMQDDYVGLGDIFISPEEEEEPYGAVQTEKFESDSALSGSDSEDEEAEAENDPQAQISPAPLVPAGASRPDLKPQPPPSFLTDNEDDDDDPFGINKNIQKIDDKPSKQTIEDDGGLFDDEPKPKKEKFDLESDNDEASSFGIGTKPPPPVIQNTQDNFDDSSSISSSKESDEPEVPKKKVKSELELAVERRRRAMGDVDSAADNDDNDDEIVQKPVKTSNKTIKTKPEPSSSTISNLTSQPLTAPPKISKPSIFGAQEDDDDIFSVAPKLPSTTIIETKPTLKLPQKKEKDMFDDASDEGDDPFSPKKTNTIPTSISIKKKDPIPTSQSTVIKKPKIITHSDGSDEDELFGETKLQSKPTPTVSTPIVTEKQKSHSSDEELFTKPQPTTTTNKDPVFTDQPPVQKVDLAPSVISTTKKPAHTTDEDSDEEMFGIPKKPPTTGTKKVDLYPKSDSDGEGETFGKSASKPKELPVFTPKPVVVNLPPPVPSASSADTDIYDDPLGIGKPVKTVPQPTKTPSDSIKKKSSDDEDDEDSPSKPRLNASALKEGEKINVKALASSLKITLGAPRPGGRPKASSITEEPPKSSVDDDQPIQNLEPPLTTVKKLPPIDSDSEDELFKTKEKQTPTTPNVEQKAKTNIENENGKSKIKDLQSLIKPNQMMRMPGAPPKPIPNKENESNNTRPSPSTEEPTAEKTMINILKDKTKVAVKKTPRTRPSRLTGAAAAAAASSTNDNDDLFALPKSTNTTTSSPSSPPAVPAIPPPSVAVPPSTPVTGLPDKLTAIAAKQTNSKEKKKFSLFDSDDSDIDELLFGVSKKKKSPVVSKPTTTQSATSKSTTKSSILPLDDDDDFLSKRPTKKNTKSVDNDDIFADIKSKTPQINKAKKDWSILEKSTTDETDDIFNTTSTKSSTPSKPKSTNVKNKSTKSFDDIFEDPLNISSKR